MLLIVGTNVGYRITELLTLIVGQVLTPQGEVAREVSVTRALLKGGSGVKKRSIRSRRVVLNERARGAIRDYLASLGRIPAPDEFLFLSREGGNRPIDRSQAQKILVRLCRDCGIDANRVSTHSLRKTFVRSVYDASKHDLIRTQRIVGHSSPVITARYLESTQSELDDVVLRVSTSFHKYFHSRSRPQMGETHHVYGLGVFLGTGISGGDGELFSTLRFVVDLTRRGIPEAVSG